MADLEPQDKQKLVADFSQMCMASEEMATQYLDANKWDLMAACNSYFADEDDKPEPTSAPAARDESYTGPRTLDGRPAPEDQRRQTQKAAAKPQQGRIATLGSLGADEDDKDDDFDDAGDDDGRGNLFAGGEKSGLAVQDPRQDGSSRSIINDIVGKAKANASRLQAAPAPGRSSAPTHFRGTGVILGGDGVESRSIPDPLGPSQSAASASVEERVLHIWQDGFSIDDGELRRFDDPANQADLAMIRSGRAPLHLMNVLPEQSVDVKLWQHDTPYSPPPKKYKPFTGSGHRLGSPVPGLAAAPATPPQPTSGVTATTGNASSSTEAPPPPPTTATAIDSSQPVLTIRVQLPDGTRLPARFNPTNTIHDVYTFIRGASSETRDRPWTLATTFPNKEHADTDTALSEMPEFKKGGTAVVKWV